MSVEQLRIEYQAIKCKGQSVQTRHETQLRRADFKGLLEQLAQLPKLSVAQEFSNRVLQSLAVDEASVRLRTDIGNDLKTNAELLNHLKLFRQTDPGLLALLKGCLHSSSGMQLHLHKFRADWQRLKKRLIGAHFYDPEMAREAVFLECIGHIFDYYYKTMSEETYQETKTVVLSLTQQWETEDLISDNSTAQLVFSNFITRSKGQRTDKELASHDDVVTNHSSNQKVVKSALLSSFIRKRAVREVPFDSEASIQEFLPIKKGKDDKQIFERSTLSRSNGLTLEPRTLTVAPISHLKKRSVDLPRSSTLSTINLIDMVQEDSENERLLAKSAQESRFAHNEMPGLSLYDKARYLTRRKLTEIIAAHCQPKLAKCYAKKLEAELFSQFFGCIQQYTLESKRLFLALSSALAKEGIADDLMTTAFDYHLIVSLGLTLTRKEASTQNSPSEPDSPKHLSSTAEGYSSILEERRAEMLPTSRHQLLGGESLGLEEESNSELLREVTRVKELEILQLKSLITKLESENMKLRSTLSKVRTCVTQC